MKFIFITLQSPGRGGSHAAESWALRAPREPSPLPNYRVPILLLTALLVAIFFRTYELGSIPPGLWFDEAFNGLDALRVLRTKGLYVFFGGNNGREPLFIYLQALSVALLGNTPLALRVVSVILGIMTVPLLYLITREMFPKEGEIALLAACGLATSFWHIGLSRTGYRGITFSFFITLAALLFWKAWRTGGKGGFIAAGIILGLSIYTYFPAQLFPLTLIGFAIWAKTSRCRHFPPLTHLALMAAVATLIVLPLVCYFILNPDAFKRRMGDVLILKGDFGQALISNAGRVAGMFYASGDENWRHNLVGRPALDILPLIGFVLGIIVCLAKRKGEHIFTLLWLVVMLFPTLLSTEAPNFLRAVGALPPIYILVAIGLAQPGKWLARRKAWTLLIAIALLGSSGFFTWRDYFTVWAHREEVYRAFEAGMVSLAEYVLHRSRDVDIYLPLEIWGHPTFLYLLNREFPPSETGTSPPSAREAICLLPPDRSPWGAFVFLHRRDDGTGAAYALRAMNSKDWKVYYEREETLWMGGDLVFDSSGIALAIEITSEEADFIPKDIAFSHPLEANLGGWVKLIGYDLEPEVIKPGGKLRLTLYWQCLREMNTNYEVFVHLLDTKWNVWGSRNEQPILGVHPTAVWRLGEVIPDQYEVEVATDAHPGKYVFEVGLFHRTTMERLAVLDAEGNPYDNKILLGEVKIVEDVDLDAVSNPLKVNLGNKVALLGYDLEGEARPGGRLKLTLYWRALGEMDVDYTVFTHLLDEEERIRAQMDSQPQGGYNPTSSWYIGEVIRDEYELALDGVPPGDYLIEVGMYELATGHRLPVIEGGQAVGDRILLPTQIQVEGR